MKISTITVCRNSRTTIARSVESFLGQIHLDKELLIIDGASTDDTVEIVKSFNSPIIRVISETDRGIYDAMNKGLKHFSGDAIGFLNSDDTYQDALCLTRLAKALEHADAAYGDLVAISDHASGEIVREWKAGPFKQGAFRKGWMPPHPTFYIRRGLAEKIGAFNLSYRISADYDFMLRALELHNPNVQYIPEVLVRFMMGGVSTAGIGAVIRGNIECLKARRQHLKTLPVDAALFLKPLLKLRQYKYL